MFKITFCLILILFIIAGCTGLSGSPSSMVYPSYHSMVNRYNSSIIVSGGYSFGKYLSRVEIYNIGTNQWNFISDLYHNRALHQSLLYDGEIVVTGGKNREGVLSKCETTQSLYQWINIAELNYPRYSHNMFILNDVIYVAGGYDKYDNPLKITERYNPFIEEWEVVADMNYASAESKTLSISGKRFISALKDQYGIESNEIAVVIGGIRLDESGKVISSNKVEFYEPGLDKWIEIKSMTYPRLYHSVNYINAEIYVAGGLDSPSTIESYNPIEGEWIRVTDFVRPRYHHTSEVYQNRIYFIGGIEKGGKVLSSVESYNIEVERMYEEYSMLNPRYKHNSVITDDGIYVLGGIDEFPLKSIEFFDFSSKTWSSSSQEDITINDNLN